MPKIIEGAKDKILACTRKHYFETGYTSLSLRQIAKECRLGVGTIYNYFPSKDDLIACIMLEDWLTCLNEMDTSIKQVSCPQDGLMKMLHHLDNYCQMYESLFKEASSSMHVIQSRHDLLVHQMQDRIHHLLTQFQMDTQFSLLLAELMLVTSTKKTISSDQFEKAVHQLLRKETHHEQF